MRRDLASLSNELHDVIVVGGGIHGACAAWEAARRGLKVALIEAGDFNQATSSNSLRTLHGGLRQLQRLDFVHMRESIRERREWLRLAPELTEPRRFVLPAARHGTRSRTMLRTALWVNDLVGRDRNRDLPADQRIPRGSMLSKAEFAGLYPGLAVDGHNGAAAWYDGVCLNTERLQLAVVCAAVRSGACAANYVRALQPLQDGGQIIGARVRDELSGRQLDLKGRMIINTTGPWVEEWLGVAARGPVPAFKASKAFNLLVRKFPFADALGLTAHNKTYFILPWNGYSLIGTRHLRCAPQARVAVVSRDEVLEFLADINPLLGEHRLEGADVRGVFSGLLPETAAEGVDVDLQRSPQIIDHSSQGLAGVLSVVGVKWTTARAVGERVARQALRRLGKVEPPALRAPELDTAAPRLPADTDPTLATRIVPDLPFVFAHIVHAARHEMAMRLGDVVRRRIPLYLSAALDRSVLTSCAAVMARELRWNRREMAAEIEAAAAELATFRGPLRAEPHPVAA
jgi:glycerol-3-phosphate dehydrogenase